MFIVQNSADKSFKHAIAVGDVIFDATHKAVTDLVAFPIGSQYLNVAAGIFYVRMDDNKEVADWVAVGGSGNAIIITSTDLSDPTAAKWGADAVLTGLKEATIQIPVPTSSWTKVNVKQVNDALAKAFPDGIEGEIEGNVRQLDYNYADISSQISNSKLPLDVLTMDGHSISVEAVFYNGTTLVDTQKFAVAVEY